MPNIIKFASLALAVSLASPAMSAPHWTPAQKKLLECEVGVAMITAKQHPSTDPNELLAPSVQTCMRLSYHLYVKEGSARVHAVNDAAQQIVTEAIANSRADHHQ